MPAASTAEVLRFLIAGAANALFGFVLYSALILLGLPLALALLVATFAGVFFNFATFGGYTFRRLEVRRLPRFLAVYGTLYLCNLAMIEGLRAATGLGPIVAQFACIAVIAPVMYMLLKARVFGEIRDE